MVLPSTLTRASRDGRANQCRPATRADRAVSAPTLAQYRYVIQFGNNSMLLRQVMRQRRWWTPGQGDPSHVQTKVDYATRTCSSIKSGGAVNFLWTQFKIRDFYDAMAKMQSCRVTKNTESKLEISCKSSCQELMVHNHFECNAHLCSKRGLVENWVALFKSHGKDPFDSFPLSFVVRSDSDAVFKEFEQVYTQCAEAKKFVWIVKPGDFSNRGSGIRIYNSLDDIRARIRSKEKCWVIQKYLERPLLVHKRKFDIRAYCLVDLDMKAYYYEDAYLRTTSEEWSLGNFGNKFAHLNNDAVQKNAANYGKFESANKLTLDEFQKFITTSGYNVSVDKDIVPQIQDRMRDCLVATHRILNPQNLTCFEVYGFDFMVDDSFSVWLIEVNTNPCLEQCNAYLSRIIPAMIDDAFSLTIDKIFPARVGDVQETPKTKWHLIFDPATDQGLVSSPGRPFSEGLGLAAILTGPLDPFRGEKTLVKTTGPDASQGLGKKVRNSRLSERRVAKVDRPIKPTGKQRGRAKTVAVYVGNEKTSEGRARGEASTSVSSVEKEELLGIALGAQAESSDSGKENVARIKSESVMSRMGNASKAKAESPQGSYEAKGQEIKDSPISLNGILRSENFIAGDT